MLCVVVPQVCWLVTHTYFSGWGSCAVTGGCVHAQATSSPKGVTAVPHPLQPSGLRTRGIPSHCSPPGVPLGCPAALQRVCQALACRPNESSKRGIAALSYCDVAQETHQSESTNIPDGVSQGRAVGLWVIAVGV